MCHVQFSHKTSLTGTLGKREGEPHYLAAGPTFGEGAPGETKPGFSCEAGATWPEWLHRGLARWGWGWGETPVLGLWLWEGRMSQWPCMGVSPPLPHT